MDVKASSQRVEKLRGKQRLRLVYLLIGSAGVAAVALSLGFGEISTARLLELSGALFSGAELSSDQELTLRVITLIRGPRLIMTALVGALLALTGMVYQSVLRNPLADPFILGVSSGAAFFAVLGSALFAGDPIATLLAAFIGGIITIALVFAVVGVQGSRDVPSLLLTGVMINFFMGAFMMLAIFVSKPTNLPDVLHMWMGTFYGLWSWQIGLLTIGLIATLAYTIVHARSLTALSLGDDLAHNVGIDVDKRRRSLLFVSSLAIALTVSFVGMIGFVGLLIPHMCRLLFALPIRWQIPINCILGATFMMLADLVARQLTLFHIELPVGVISALIGAPFFIYILQRSYLPGSGRLGGES